MTLIQIQEQYIETVNTGMARWSHRKDGGHSHRIIRGAHRQAARELTRLGFNETQISEIISQARDMAALLRIAEDSED